MKIYFNAFYFRYFVNSTAILFDQKSVNKNLQLLPIFHRYSCKQCHFRICVVSVFMPVNFAFLFIQWKSRNKVHANIKSFTVILCFVCSCSAAYRAVDGLVFRLIHSELTDRIPLHDHWLDLAVEFSYCGLQLCCMIVRYRWWNTLLATVPLS